VSARDKATNKEQKIVIQSSGGLSKDQIENLIRESEKFAVMDKKRRELIEEINKAESILHDTDSKMEEFKSQLPNDEYDNLKNQITNLRDKLAKIDRENDTVDEIKPQVDEFQRNSLKIFEMAYKKVRLFSLVKIILKSR
jgi:molecular chaperone DnaK